MLASAQEANVKSSATSHAAHLLRSPRGRTSFQVLLGSAGFSVKMSPGSLQLMQTRALSQQTAWIWVHALSEPFASSQASHKTAEQWACWRESE